MNRFGGFSRLVPWISVLLLSAVVAGCGGGDSSLGTGNTLPPPTAAGAGTGTGGAGGRGPAPVVMGTAGNFVILARTTVTDVPTSAVTGNVGLSPGTGAALLLTCAEVTGVINTSDAAGPLPCRVQDSSGLTTAIGDQGTAYTDANARAPDYTELATGNLGGLNLGPATYKWSTGVLIPTTLTLTGGPNDVWIFQIAQGLSISSGVRINLAGGALAQNVYWATFAAADLGTTSHFSGTLLSQTSITMKTGASISGKLSAGSAINLDTNVVGP
jgi:hypothetical protein